MPALAQLTSAASFLALGLSLWLGCYLITRSPRSRLAWQAGLTLWSLAGIFFDNLIAIHPAPSTDWWPGWPIFLPITLWYHLSLEIMPKARAARQRTLLPAMYLTAAVFDGVTSLTPWFVADARRGLGLLIKPFTLGSLFFIYPVSLGSISILMLRNFWAARQAAPTPAVRKQLDSLVRGSLAGVAALAYGVAAVTFNLQLPALPLVLVLGLAVVAIGYGAVRYSALTEGRIRRYDFAFSGLLVIGVAALYYGVLAFFEVSFILQVSAIILVILTHSGFDFVRRALDQTFLRKREQAFRATLHSAATQVGERAAIGEGLRSALAAVVNAVDARWGLIALLEDDTYTVQASFHSISVGEALAREGLRVKDLTTLSPGAANPPLAGLAVIAPLIGEQESLGAMLLGPPRGAPAYSERDLDLIAEAADDLAEVLYVAQRQDAHAKEIHHMLESFQAREQHLQAEIDSLRRPAEPDSVDHRQWVGDVEDALRHLHDYSYLGEHTLASAVPADHDGSPRPTHLDRGKDLNAFLMAAVEELRPAGVEPIELPSREWHPYVVLRDAYVRGESNRDIMARLYVSEATFHRTRRSAIRAVTKALFERRFNSGEHFDRN